MTLAQRIEAAAQRIADLFLGPKWVYGTCNGKPARKGRRGNVQFILWRKGEHGFEEDHWRDMNTWWWPDFVAASLRDGG